MKEEFSYITEASIIPYGMKWRAGINDPAVIQNQSPFGDPGQAMAQAFLQAYDRKPPKVVMPDIRMSKQDQYCRDVMNNLAPIPSFDVTDDRPETPGELDAQLHPQQINEPGKSSGVPNDFQLSYTGEWIGDTEFIDMPVNGLPNIYI